MCVRVCTGAERLRPLLIPKPGGHEVHVGVDFVVLDGAVVGVFCADFCLFDAALLNDLLELRRNYNRLLDRLWSWRHGKGPLPLALAYARGAAGHGRLPRWVRYAYNVDLLRSV